MWDWFTQKNAHTLKLEENRIKKKGIQSTLSSPQRNLCHLPLWHFLKAGLLPSLITCKNPSEKKKSELLGGVIIQVVNLTDWEFRWGTFSLVRWENWTSGKTYQGFLNLFLLHRVSVLSYMDSVLTWLWYCPSVWQNTWPVYKQIKGFWGYQITHISLMLTSWHSGGPNVPNSTIMWAVL